jgi:hypothetical protein
VPEALIFTTSVEVTVKFNSAILTQAYALLVQRHTSPLPDGVQ